MNQARYYILTIPHADFVPYQPPTITYIRGQLERGEGGFLHWQIIVHFKSKIRRLGVKSVFGNSCHCEPTRSAAAVDYVWKENTRVEGTQFELGNRTTNRNSNTDWEAVRMCAKRGRLDDVAPDIYVRYFFCFLLSFLILDVITSCEESNRTIWHLLLSNDAFTCIGVQLAQANLDAPGMKPVFQHTRKIRAVNSGAATVIMNMLSWMSSVEELTSVICSDGSIDIQCLLKLKEVQSSLKLA